MMDLQASAKFNFLKRNSFIWNLNGDFLFFFVPWNYIEFSNPTLQMISLLI